MTRTLNLCASVSLISLTFLCLAWEFWLSPVRAGGSALALKALPLLIPLFGILHGRRYTHQWASFLALAYITEGIVRSGSDAGLSRWLAVAELFLATTFFLSCVFYARETGKASRAAATSPVGAGDTPSD
jgi:uncharacterized membrane protein